jgi:hypothetical protein
MELDSGFHVDSCGSIQVFVNKFRQKEKFPLLQILCEAANNNCLDIEDLALFTVAKRHFAIDESDFFNDRDSLTQESIDYGLTNWKPVIGGGE